MKHKLNAGCIQRSSGRRAVFWLFTTVVVALVLGCALAISSANVWHARTPRGDEYSTATTKVAGNSALNVSAVAQQASRIEAEVVTIRPTGFEPTEITRPPGRFLLAIENRSGLQAMQLRLDRIGLARVFDFQMPRNKHDWSNGVDLPPGTYVLSDAYHTKWACTITITAK